MQHCDGRAAALLRVAACLSALLTIPVAAGQSATAEPATLTFTVRHSAPWMPSNASAVYVPFMAWVPAATPLGSSGSNGNSSGSSSSGGGGSLPLIFLLNGANVEAQDYAGIATLLARRGYTVVGSNYVRPLPLALQAAVASLPAANWTLPPGCSRDSLLAPSVGLLRSFLSAVSATAAAAGTRGNAAADHTGGGGGLMALLPALAGVERRGVVLLGHSFGGAAALTALAGACPAADVVPGQEATLGPCEGAAPQLVSLARPLHGSAGAGAGAAACAGAVRTGLLRGVVVFEGTPPRPPHQGAAASKPLVLPPGGFVLYLGGEAVAPRLRSALTSTVVGGASSLPRPSSPSPSTPTPALPSSPSPSAPTPARPSSAPSTRPVAAAAAASAVTAAPCTCAALAIFPGLNHYGINGFQSAERGHRTRCGRPASADAPDFRTTPARAAAGLSDMAALIDAFVRSQGGYDGASHGGKLAALKAQGASLGSFELVLRGDCRVTN